MDVLEGVVELEFRVVGPSQLALHSVMAAIIWGTAITMGLQPSSHIAAAQFWMTASSI